MRKSRTVVGVTALAALAALVVSSGSAGAATKTTKKAAAKTTVKPAATAAPATTPAAAARKGGKIVFGLEAESSEGFLPPSSQWALSGGTVSVSVFDRLVAVNEKGENVGWLAESFSPSSDYKTWTFKIRSGIKFHNGEDLNADAVKLAMDRAACGSVTGNSFLPLNAANTRCKDAILQTGIASDGAQTVTFSLVSPWVTFPTYLAGQGGAIAAPAQLKAGNRNAPIGTGPFVFKEWRVGERFVATRNPTYWRPGLPVADEVEFRPIPDQAARIAALQSGQINFLQTDNALAQQDIDGLVKDGKLKITKSEAFGEVSYDMLNVGAPPFNTKECRLAAAYGQDVATIIKLRSPGLTQADGPFTKGSLGYLPDSGFPKFNLAEAQKQFALCKAKLGGGDVNITIGTTSVPDNILTSQLMKQQQEAVGFKVSLANLEQQAYIGGALIGRFQWLMWRNHGGADPDGQRVWWHSETAITPPGFALNFGRIKDAQIDSALDQIRTNSDPAVRKRAAENINRVFAEEAYNLWRVRTRWSLAYCTTCGGLDDQRTVGGEKVPLLAGGGVNVAFLYKG